MPGENVESLVKKSFRQRLKADTSIGVADLMHPFKTGNGLQTSFN